MSALIKVLVVDDHELVRTGITRMLADIPDIRVVGESASGEEALSLVRQVAPDVVLMDVRMPGMGGLEATRKLLRQNSALRIVAVTICDEDPFPARLLQAGAAGYLTKGACLEEMVRAIRQAADGQRYLSPEVAQRLALRAFDGDVAQSPFDQLSEREMQVTLMIVHGERIQDISDKLCLSPKTVNTYRYRIFEKLGVESDVQLALLAVKHGLSGVNAG